MANEKTKEEQIALIKRSIAEWNLWRMGRTDRADLRSADLRSADLSRADLSFADLSSADLSGAIKIERLLCRVYRSDEYLFMGFATNAGLMIKAGCQLLSPDEGRAYIAKQYPDTPKAAETLRIIKYIEDCAQENE